MRKKNTTAIKPKKQRRQHPHEIEAEKWFTPFEGHENPDWLVGAN
jgi:hypothetical protein